MIKSHEDIHEEKKILPSENEKEKSNRIESQ